MINKEGNELNGALETYLNDEWEQARKRGGEIYADHYREGIEDGIKSLEAKEYWHKQFQLEQKQQCAGRWVKPIEEKYRPPRFGKEVIVRSLDSGAVKLTKNMGHCDGWDIAMDYAFEWVNTEWLDETRRIIR